MSNERKLIAASVFDRKAFETIDGALLDGDFTEQALVVWKGLRKYYSRDPHAPCCDPQLLENEVVRSLTSPKHKDAMGGLIRDICSEYVSPENVVYDLIQCKKEAAGSKLATALLSGKYDDAATLMEEYRKWEEASSLEVEAAEVIIGMPVAQLSSAYDPSKLIRIWPSSLNSRLGGGLLRGHHVVVFARPEMGKTMFMVNTLAGFCAQGLRTVYVGNEDPMEDIILRTVCRITKRQKFDVLAEPEATDEAARAAGYDNIVFAPLSPGTPREIRNLAKKYSPDVIIIDQLRNLRMKEDNRTVQLERAATEARNIGKECNALMLSVTQAGDSASGKAVLDMGDVDSSNTGIPAQADVMIGIGATQEDLEMGRRVISLPKNKPGSNHDFFAVRVNPEISRIVNLET